MCLFLPALRRPKPCAIAQKYAITIYNGVFIALAEQVNGILVSDDSKHHGQIKNKHIMMLKAWKE